jgi:hypothetical protein
VADLASQVFDLLSERGVAKAALRRRFREDSCINSTRVLFDVYRAVGIPAEAVSVRTRIYSPGFVERVHREGRMPKTPEELQSWTSEPGVWSVGIGYGIGHGKNKWPGHLVLRSGSHLIDATIDQANRPQHGIVMPAMLLLAQVPEAFWRGEEPLAAEINDCHILYEARPNDNSYLGSPAWSGRSHRGRRRRGVGSIPGIEGSGEHTGGKAANRRAGSAAGDERGCTRTAPEDRVDPGGTIGGSRQESGQKRFRRAGQLAGYDDLEMGTWHRRAVAQPPDGAREDRGQTRSRGLGLDLPGANRAPKRSAA